MVENNIISGFHPHVWFKHSGDIVRRNIMWTDHYLPAGGMPATPWGKEMDNNLVHREGMTEPQPATKLAEQSKRDAHSIVADALFVDPANGDFRVKDGSPALKLGFVNFPMDQFGVQKPELKAIARTPEMPNIGNSGRPARKEPPARRASYVLQAQIRDISGLGDRSAYGLPDEIRGPGPGCSRRQPGRQGRAPEGRRDSRLQRPAGSDGGGLAEVARQGRRQEADASRPPQTGSRHRRHHALDKSENPGPPACFCPQPSDHNEPHLRPLSRPEHIPHPKDTDHESHAYKSSPVSQGDRTGLCLPTIIKSSALRRRRPAARPASAS